MERLVLDDGTSERASQLHGRLHHPRSVNQALTRRIFIGRTTQEHSEGSSTSCTARRWPCWWRVGGRVCGSDRSDFGRSRAKHHQFSGRVNPPSRIPRSYMQPSRCRLRQSTITSHSSNRHFVTPLSQLARLPASKAGKAIPPLPRHKPFLTAHIYQTAQLCLYANPNHVKIPSSASNLGFAQGVFYLFHI